MRQLTFSIALLITACGGSVPTVVEVDASSPRADLGIVETTGAEDTAHDAGTSDAAAAPSAKIKWNPGHYMMSVAIGGAMYQNTDGTPGNYEIETLAKYHDGVVGYAPLFTWGQFENKTEGEYDFSEIATVFNYLQQQIPGAHMAIGVAAYNNFSQSAKVRSNLGALDASGDGLPAYIANGGSATYGDGPRGASQAGYALTAYTPASGSTPESWVFLNAALWNENVMTRYMALFTAMGQSTILPPYKGAQYTIDAHPLIELVFDYGPTDLEVGNNGNPIAPADYSTAGWKAQWLRRMPAMAAAFPHTSIGLMPGFGAYGEAVTDQLDLVDAMKDNRIAITCTDVQADCTDESKLSYAQNYFIGNSYASTSAGPVWTAGGNPDLRGKMPSMPTIQAPDYNHGAPKGTSINTVADVTEIFTAATANLRASHIFWAAASDTDYNVLKDWPAFIYPALQTCTFPAANEVYPSSYPQ